MRVCGHSLPYSPGLGRESVRGGQDQSILTLDSHTLHHLQDSSGLPHTQPSSREKEECDVHCRHRPWPLVVLVAGTQTQPTMFPNLCKQSSNPPGVLLITSQHTSLSLIRSFIFHHRFPKHLLLALPTMEYRGIRGNTEILS